MASIVCNLPLRNFSFPSSLLCLVRTLPFFVTSCHQGFGFVTYSSNDEANAAVDALNGQDLDGRAIRYAQTLGLLNLGLIPSLFRVE